MTLVSRQTSPSLVNDIIQQLSQIFNSQPSLISASDTLSAVFACCTSQIPLTSLLLKNTRLLFIQVSESSLQRITTSSNIVSSFQSEWIHYKKASGYCSVLLEYLDRSLKMSYEYSSRKPDIPIPVFQIALDCFRDHVILKIKNDGDLLVLGILSMVNIDRISHFIFGNITDILECFGIWK